MKINFIKYILIFFLIFTLKAQSIEDVKDFTNSIADVQKKFEELAKGSTEESKIIDEAIKEIDKVTEFVKEQIKNNETDNAIKALEFIEKSLTDVSNILPTEFSSDMSKADLSKFKEEDMKFVNEVTADMKQSKEKKMKKMVTNMVDLSDKGLDSFGVSENLNNLGIDTIKLDINLDKRKKMETWTKEQWADSYKGSVLTSDGKEVITDKEIASKVTDLEKKLQTNTQSILDKRTSLNELQSKVDPLNSRITDLNNQKVEMLAKYNEQLIKQTSNTISEAEIAESKKTSDDLNSQLAALTNQIKSAEEQSNSLQAQVQSLNLELTNEIATKSQLQANIGNLNNQLSINQSAFSKKELQLDQLKNSDLNAEINDLNNQLESVSLKRDFAQRDFDKALDKEVEAFQYFYSALGNIQADNYDIQAEYAVKEVEAILNPDPKQYRAFELEKYSKLAGFSQDFINDGLKAIENDNWDKQKSIRKTIEKALAKNPQSFLPDGWYLTTSSESDLNVQIAEEKAIQEAVYASIELNNVKEKIHTSITEKTKDIQPLIGLNTTWIQYSSLQSNVVETDLVVKEIDKILEGNQNLQLQQDKVNQFKSALAEVETNADKFFKEYSDNRNAIAQTRENLKQEYNRLRNLPTNQRFKRENWDKRMSLSMQIYNTRVPQSLNKDQVVNLKKNELERGIINAEYEISSIRNNVSKQARENVLKTVEEAQNQYEQIVAEESKDLTDLQNKVSSILKEVPTFEGSAETVADLDPVMLRAKLVDMTNFGNTNEEDAVYYARKELAEIGLGPVSKYMTGPRWEASNIKTAAIVRSKKYSFVDDYEYINALYNDPIPLNASDRKELEGDIKGVLGDSNVVIDALDAKVEDLSNKLKLTKDQNETLTADIARLESELSGLKTSEQEIQNKIANLSNQFNSKENLIAYKKKTLSDLTNQLNPIDKQVKSLDAKRSELNTKLDEQLNKLNDQIASQGKANAETKALKEQFENQIAQIDNQILNYNTESKQISDELNSINNELKTLETETPEISKKINSLNKDLEDFVNVKADLAMAAAAKHNLEIQEKVKEKVKNLENKSLISIEGTNVFRVVDNDSLLNDKGDFEIPKGTLTLNGSVYTAGAVQPEKLFSFSKINTDEEINKQMISLNEQLSSGSITEENFKKERDKINSKRNNLNIEFSKIAAEQLGQTGKLTGGKQDFKSTTLGSWVLVNAVTGEQMTNPLTGHSGGVVCTGDVCGQAGSLGKMAASFGGMYVLEGLADQKGNVKSICSGGGCKFDVETLRVLGPQGIQGNVFNDKGEGLFQKAFTGAELNEIEKHGMTTLQRQHAIEFAMKNNIKINANKLVSQEDLDTQAKGLAHAAKTNTWVAEVNKQAGAYTKFKTDNFKKISSTVDYGGQDLSNTAKQASESASEVASAASEAASAAKEATAAATEAAKEATKTASKVLTGNDLAELSKLANDAKGAWVLVDAATGKQMTNPINGYSGSMVCSASNCGKDGYEGKRAASFGGVYVLERLADPKTGNVAGGCAGGNCQFDIGK